MIIINKNIMSEKEESPKRNNMKDYYTIDPNKQINFINNSLFELDTIEDKYDKGLKSYSQKLEKELINLHKLYLLTLNIFLFWKLFS